MNTKEQIYNGIVIAMGLFYVLGALTLLGLIVPQSETQGILITIAGVEIFMAALLLTTAFMNIKAGTFRPINTTVQIAFLFISIYGIPLAIWGIFLLRARLRQAAPGTSEHNPANM